MKYYLLALKNYAKFTGRSIRSEYWYFVLFNIIFAIVAAVLDNLLGLTFSMLPYGFIYFAYAEGENKYGPDPAFNGPTFDFEKPAV